MKYIRIGRIEFYRTPGWDVDIKPASCGCRLFAGFGLGVTLLGGECREAQSSKFFEVGE